MKSITKKQFRQWIYESRGEAIRWVKEHGDEGIESVIEESCLREVDYPEPCSDHLFWYMAELIQSTVNPRRYLDFMLSRFQTPKKQDDREYIAGIITEFCKRGDENAQNFVKSNWKHDLETGKTELAACYVGLGAVKAYREVWSYIASKRIPELKSDNDTWSLTSALFERAKHQKIEDIHDELRQRYPHVESLIYAWKPKTPQPDPTIYQNLSLAEIRMLGKDDDGMQLGYWRRLALKEDWVKAADILRLDLGTKEAIRWLEIYRLQPFEGDIEILLQWIDKEETRHKALKALGAVRHPRARKAALQWIKDEEYYLSAISAFRSNYEKGDEELLFEVVQSNISDPPEDQDFLYIDLVAENNPGRQWHKFMRFAFDQNPCQICRLGYAEYLNRYRLLTEIELVNLSYDGYRHTRKWARRILGRRSKRQKTREPQQTYGNIEPV